MNKLLLAGLMSVLTVNQVMAAPVADDPSKSPLGCRDQGYQFKLDVMSILPHAEGDKQSLYFIFNRLNRPLHLYHMLNEASTRSIYLNHVIQAQQWGVLATSEKELQYICAVDGGANQYGTIVNCSDSVKVCEYARVKFGLNNKGNYWFVNSNSRNGAVRDVTNYGIIPR